MSKEISLFSEKEIQEKINEIAKIINEKHNDGDDIVFICVLKGGFMFFSDLMKKISPKLNCIIDFIQTSSYSNYKKKKSISIKKNIDLKTTEILKDKHIYIIDDIFDTGDTILFLEKWLEFHFPKEITPVCLFKRHLSSKNNLIYGFELYDEAWLHGYGMDDENGFSRNLVKVCGSIINID